MTRTTNTGTRWVYLAVFGGYTGQQIFTPLLPPLARDLSLTEFEFGLVMSASAAVVALVSPWWGRASDRWGRKPLLVGSLIGAAVGLLAFATTISVGTQGLLSGTALLITLLLTRGVLFGGSLAALPVAAQAYVADATPDEEARVKGLSRVGAAIGLGLVLGPGLGGLIVQFGLTAALYTAPVLMLITAVIVVSALPQDQRVRSHALHTSSGAQRTRPLRPWDHRVWPLLLVGAGIYLSTSLLQMSLGFLIQDRLSLETGATVEITGLALLAGGIPMLVVQAWVIPRLRWRPLRLMQVGIPVTATAFVGIALSDSLALLVACTVLSGVGHSLAIPGYTSGISLRVGPDEQGEVAGLAASVNAATLIVGPLAATALYQVGSALPFAIGACLLVILLMFLLVGRQIRHVPDTEASA